MILRPALSTCPYCQLCHSSTRCPYSPIQNRLLDEIASPTRRKAAPVGPGPLSALEEHKHSSESPGKYAKGVLQKKSVALKMKRSRRPVSAPAGKMRPSSATEQHSGEALDATDPSLFRRNAVKPKVRQVMRRDALREELDVLPLPPEKNPEPLFLQLEEFQEKRPETPEEPVARRISPRELPPRWTGSSAQRCRSAMGTRADPVCAILDSIQARHEEAFVMKIVRHRKYEKPVIHYIEVQGIGGQAPQAIPRRALSAHSGSRPGSKQANSRPSSGKQTSTRPSSKGSSSASFL